MLIIDKKIEQFVTVHELSHRATKSKNNKYIRFLIQFRLTEVFPKFKIRTTWW